MGYRFKKPKPGEGERLPDYAGDGYDACQEFRYLREQLALRPSDLAELTGRTMGTLRSYAKGQRVPPPDVLDVMRGEVIARSRSWWLGGSNFKRHCWSGKPLYAAHDHQGRPAMACHDYLVALEAADELLGHVTSSDGVLPGLDDKQLLRSCWRRACVRASISREEAARIAGTSEHLVGLIGLEYRAMGQTPSEAAVDAMERLADERTRRAAA